MKNKKFMWHELMGEDGNLECPECNNMYIGKEADYDENPMYGDTCPQCERKENLLLLIRKNRKPMERFITRLGLGDMR